MDAIDDSVDAVLEYGDVLTPPNIAQFLAANSWTCQIDRTYDQVWLQPSDVGERVVPVLLPREPRFVDYQKRLVEAAHTIARAYGWRISNFAEHVAAVHADLFFVRVNQFSRDGTIPLKQATVLLNSIDQMIRSAAVHAYNPKSSGRGRLPAAVTEFLSDDIRMGHTKKGSFIITVAARIDDPDGVHSDPGVPAERLNSQAEASAEPDDINSQPDHVADVEGQPEEIVVDEPEVPLARSPDVLASYTRQVMTTLARSLDVTMRYISQGEDSIPFDTAVDEGLRLPVVHALQKIGEAEGLQSIDLSFEWAAIEPQQASVPSRIELDRVSIDALPDLERRLTAAIAPVRVTIIGPVTELRRAESGADAAPSEEGDIIVRAEVEGRVRRIAVTLTGADYDWAIRAHREKLPFTVTGELGKRGNVWCLNDPIEVDRAFLEFHLRNS